MLTFAFDLYALNDFLAKKPAKWDATYMQNEHNFGMTFEQAIAVGILSPREADYHSFLSICYYDGYKDVHGVKARWVDYNSLSIAELESMNDRLDAAYEEVRASEIEAEKRAESDFEALIAKTMAMGAGDRETALRWIVGGSEFAHIQDVEHYVWNYGLLFTDYGRDLVKQIRAILDQYNLWYDWNQEAA